MMNSEKFRKQLVKLVKASGQEIIDRAEDLVGNGDLISDFNIWIRFPMDGHVMNELPTIEVIRSYCSKRCFDVLLEDNKND